MEIINKKTLVLGASSNPSRYSNMAIKKLRVHGNDVVAVGLRDDVVGDVKITKEHPQMEDIDTVTLYLNADNQKPYYDYILSLKPKRIIFNPGAENRELEMLAHQQNIPTMEACTLVLLSTGQF